MIFSVMRAARKREEEAAQKKAAILKAAIDVVEAAEANPYSMSPAIDNALTAFRKLVPKKG